MPPTAGDHFLVTKRMRVVIFLFAKSLAGSFRSGRLMRSYPIVAANVLTLCFPCLD